MRAVVWIVEDTWQTCVDEARALPDAAQITLVHVAPSDAEALATEAGAGLLGRHPPPPLGPPPREISQEAAQALLADAATRLGRPAHAVARRGRVEREVVDACGAADLLVLARDGDPSRLGPKSIGPRARFVIDHAPCRVLLIWADAPPGIDTIPPHRHPPP
jgi:hypothetical protein